MRHPILGLLVIASVGLAGSPRVVSEELSNVKPALQSKGDFRAGHQGNASFTGFETFPGLDLSPRQYTCRQGRKTPL